MVTLATDDARRRLMDGEHGVLCTLHRVRGVDAVPVVYASDGTAVGIPIDLVKPKASTRLQRERNLEADPRATLLVEHWDRDDWTRLWWVRAELHWARDDQRADPLADLLAQRHVQYRDRPFARVLVFDVIGLTGWTGATS